MTMKRPCCALLAVFCLSGCAGTDWDPFSDPEPVEVLIATPLPAAAPPSYDFCRRIAAQEGAKDNPTRETQVRRTEVSFRDCVASFGDA
jgi:hypothetical protein